MYGAHTTLKYSLLFFENKTFCVLSVSRPTSVSSKIRIQTTYLYIYIYTRRHLVARSTKSTTALIIKLGVSTFPHNIVVLTFKLKIRSFGGKNVFNVQSKNRNILGTGIQHCITMYSCLHLILSIPHIKTIFSYN